MPSTVLNISSNEDHIFYSKKYNKIGLQENYLNYFVFYFLTKIVMIETITILSYFVSRRTTHN